MARFATGKYAWGICDTCSLRCRYVDMRTERQTRMRKCPDCLDDPYPYWAFKRPPDAQALRYPRPEPGDPGEAPEQGWFVNSTDVLVNSTTDFVNSSGASTGTIVVPTTSAGPAPIQV